MSNTILRAVVRYFANRPLLITFATVGVADIARATALRLIA